VGKLLKLLGISPIRFWIVIAILAVWVGVIVTSGAGWNPWSTEWDFSNTGAFGDSFGPLSAFMASIAAVSAILAYRAQSAELTRLRRRQSHEDGERRRAETFVRLRDAEQDRQARKTLFEGTFFNLLDTFTKIVSQVDISSSSTGVKSAQDAFQSILYFFGTGANSASNKQTAWNATIKKYRNDLNHYFRFMYHIVQYVDRSDTQDKYFYVRLLRSMLSESEIILLGINCEFGEGREKFLPLVEKYSMLHNISDTGRRKWFGDTAIKNLAFEPPETD
jgi:hypothetical protein